MSYPLSDESAVYPAAHVEPLGVDPCIACVFSLVEVMLCHSIVADDLDFIAIVKLANLVAVVIAGLGAECKLAGLQSMDCSDGAFTEAFLAVPAADCLYKFFVAHFLIFVSHDLNLLYFYQMIEKVLSFSVPHICG